MTDTIEIKNLRCYGYTGVLPEEQVLGQWFEVNVTLWVDLRRAGQSDRLGDTVDYRQGIERIKQRITESKYALVERLTEAIAEDLLGLKGIEKVRVQLTKVAAPIPDFGGQIVIDLTRPRL